MSLPKIEKLEAIKLSIPLSKLLKFGLRGQERRVDHVLVRVTTNDGITGYGEARAVANLLGESQASIVWAVEHWIAPKLQGLPLFAIEKIWDEMESIHANNTAKGAVDIAVHDALAKSLGMPLYKLLGGWTDRISLTWIVFQAGLEEMIQECLQAREKGFKSFKVKVGIDPKKDVEVIRGLRQHLGDDVLIYVDANQAYTYREASRVLPVMENDGVNMVEDPIPYWDTRGRLRLFEQLSVPIIADESAPTPIDVKRECDLGAITTINVKTQRTGYFQSRKVINLAEQAGYSCILGTMVESDIGALASAHFGAACKIFSYPAEISYFLRMEDHLLRDPIQVQNGMLVLPDKPGLGAELDEDKIKHFQK
jgi:L-alanine-DL-glutamate epimerase-like enolase superfamily enzyme